MSTNAKKACLILVYNIGYGLFLIRHSAKIIIWTLWAEMGCRALAEFVFLFCGLNQLI